MSPPPPQHSEPPSGPAPSRRPLPVLFSIVVVDLVGFGIVMPILPFYAKAFGASATLLGLLMMSYAAAQFLCAPLWGRLSDRIGRRPVLLFTVAGTAVSLLALGLAPSMPWLFAARILAGSFAANISVASATIGDLTSAEDRTRWMGMLGASFGVGFVVGPALGGLLVPYGYAVPMLAAAALAALNWVNVLVSLGEPPRVASTAGSTAHEAGRFAVLRDPLVLRLCAANLAFGLAVAQLETLFAFFMADRFGSDARQVAFILVGMAVLMGGIQGGAMRRLAASYRERSLIVTGCSLLALCFVLLPLVGSWPALLAVLVVCAASRAIVQPPLMSLASMAAAAGRRGQVMGVFQSAASLARVVGPLAGGLLYDLSLPTPFWMAGGLLFGAALLASALPDLAGRVDPGLSPEAQTSARLP